MSRFGFGTGFGLSNIFSGVANEIFTANVPDMNGTSMYFKNTTDEILATGATDFTIMAWVNRNELAVDHGIFYESTTNGETWTRLVFQIVGDALTAGHRTTFNGSFVNYGSYGSVPKDEDVLLVVAVKNGTQSFYINDTLVGTGTQASTGLSDHGSFTFVGANQPSGANGDWMDGTLYTVQVDSEYKTQEQVTAYYNGGISKCYASLDSAEKATKELFLPLYNGSDVAVGQELVDQANGIVFDNIGATPFTATAQIECEANLNTDPVPDYLFNYKLDGTDSSLTRVGAEDFRLSPSCEDGIGSWYNGINEYHDGALDSDKVAVGAGAFSISGWVNTTTTNTVDIIGNGSGSSANSFRVRLTSGATVRIRIGSTNTDSTISVNNGQWRHIALVLTGTGGTVDFYIDGVLDNSAALPAYNLTDSSVMTVGTRSDNVTLNLFDGGLDGIRFYDRVLTPTEITALHAFRCDFSPSQITTVAWYDPSQALTVTSALNLASQIDDIGTSGLEPMVQGVGSNQMSTGLTNIGGLNVLSSTTADRFMENITFPMPASGNITLSFVAQVDGQTANVSASLISMDSSNPFDWQLSTTSTSQFNAVLTSTGIGSSTDALTGAPYTGPDIWTMVFDWDAGTKKIFVNGVERSSGTYTGSKIDLVQELRVFTNRASSQFLSGKFGEMVIHEDVSDSQRELDEGYLAWKWGLVASLDAGHPYKSAPPRI